MSAIKNRTYSNLGEHCRACQGCYPKFRDTECLYLNRDAQAHEIVEAFIMCDRGSEACVSQLSVVLSEKKKKNSGRLMVGHALMISGESFAC